MPRAQTATRAARALFLCLAALALMGLAGCGHSNPPLIQEYLPAYPPQQWPEKAALPAEIKVIRMGSSVVYNSRDMIYADSQNKRGTYTYHQWLAYPSDVASELLGRDLMDTGWFRAVYGPGQTEPGRFQLNGGLTRCLEVDNRNGWEAQVDVVLNLIDSNKTQPLERVLWQKQFKATEPIAKKGAEGFAAALSRGLMIINRRVAVDVYTAVASRLAEDPSGDGGEDGKGDEAKPQGDEAKSQGN